MNSHNVDEYYKEYYHTLHDGSKLSFFNSLMHHSMEFPNRKKNYSKVLEIGCGNFEHTYFIQHKLEHLVVTDIREVTKNDLNKLKDWSSKSNHESVRFIRCDALNLPFQDHEFDRVVAGCLLLHLQDVPSAITEWLRVLKNNGILEMLVPCESGLPLRLFRRTFSERYVRNLGIPLDLYRFVNDYDHVNSFSRAMNLTKCSLNNQTQLRIRYFSFWFFTFMLSEYICNFQNPKD
jgi:ubiquinone/menaquinone biosynthesis C-methylase UbiE